ncbi:MAG: hypothetical protein AAFP90_16365, partial [Planctomycetota bacterium]
MDIATLLFLLLIAFSSLFVLSDARRGIYVVILIEFLRDPIRKIAEDQSVLITLSGSVVWGALIVGVLIRKRPLVARTLNLQRNLKRSVQLLFVALVPGTLMAIAFLPRGYLVAGIGAASYVGPILGLLAGMAEFRTPKALLWPMAFFCLLNTVAISSVLFEYAGYEHPVLGGIDEFEWIRYHGRDVVDLMAGVYRSPDVMGLHAAMCIVFALVLFQFGHPRLRGVWLVSLIFLGFCLLLCGRRKMIGIPIAFVFAQLMLSYFTGRIRKSRILRSVVIASSAALAGMGAFVYSTADDDIYTSYASSLFTDGAQRGQELVGNSVLATVYQTGFLGAGLGFATQGRYYLSGPDKSGLTAWQEDGVSRLFAELGIPGVLLLVFAGLAFFAAIFARVRSLRSDPADADFRVAILAIVFGVACSFAISHQQFSGDPSIGCFVLLISGFVFSEMQRRETRSRGMVMPQPIGMHPEGPSGADHAVTDTIDATQDPVGDEPEF